MRKAFPFFLLSILIVSCGKKTSKDISKNPDYTTWQDYLGDPARTHFSTLSQIDTSNVSNLQLAWSYKSGGLEEGRTTQIQTNPLIVGDKLYGVNAAIELFALNAATGEELWKFSPNAKDESGLGLNRLSRQAIRASSAPSVAM